MGLALCALVGTAVAQFPPVNPPRLPSINIPGLRDLMQSPAPLTTTFDQATEGLEFLDGWNPELYGAYRALSETVKTETGWELSPGSYTGVIHTFCAHAGTRGPSQGLGYVYAPYQGARAELLKNIMRRYPASGVEQSDTQRLVWAILARAKMNSLQGGAREAALRLMEPGEIAMLESGGLDFLDDRIMRELMGPVDAALRPIHQAENQLRGMLYQANRPFAELERVAVLPPIEDPSEFLIQGGRWLWHPDGYLIRYRPQGYSRTTVEIVVPRPAQIIRDSKNRITRINMADGWYSEVEYDDTVMPQSVPDEPNLRAFKFKRITWGAPPNENGPREFSVEDEGWTFVTNPQLSRFEELWASLNIRQDGWFDNAVGRLRHGRERWDQMQEARRQTERLDRILRGESRDEDFLDMGHYRDGLNTVRGSQADRVNWIAEHHTRQTEALMSATNIISRLGEGNAHFDPSDTLIMPANRSSQRLMGAGLAH